MKNKHQQGVLGQGVSNGDRSIYKEVGEERKKGGGELLNGFETIKKTETDRRTNNCFHYDALLSLSLPFVCMCVCVWVSLLLWLAGLHELMQKNCVFFGVFLLL